MEDSEFRRFKLARGARNLNGTSASLELERLERLERLESRKVEINSPGVTTRTLAVADDFKLGLSPRVGVGPGASTESTLPTTTVTGRRLGLGRADDSEDSESEGHRASTTRDLGQVCSTVT